MRSHLICAVALLLLQPAAGQHELHEAALAAHLANITSQFGPTVIPLKSDDTMDLTVSLMPMQLVDVDSVNENLEVSMLLEVSWRDELHVWNSSEFGDIQRKFIDHTQVWTPHILIHGAVGKKQLLEVDSQVLLVSDAAGRTTATALWVQELHFTCDFDMSKFPLDKQECKLPLTATAFRQPLYRTRTSAADMSVNSAVSLFMGNSEWNLTGFDMRNESIEFIFSDGNVNNITTATAVFSIRRYSTYYEVVVTVPLILLTVLQLLTYLVPLDSGEKTGCGVTVLLSFTVFLLLIDNIVPKSRLVPIMVYFITVAIVISAASLVYNCLLLRMNATSSHVKMPRWMEALLVNGLGCFMCLRCCEEKEDKSEAADAGSDACGCNKWKLAAEALERLGFVIHVPCVVALCLWMQLQL